MSDSVNISILRKSEIDFIIFINYSSLLQCALYNYTCN